MPVPRSGALAMVHRLAGWWLYRSSSDHFSVFPAKAGVHGGTKPNPKGRSHRAAFFVAREGGCQIWKTRFTFYLKLLC